MSRMVGTVSRGVRAPIIRSGDNLAEIVTASRESVVCWSGLSAKPLSIRPAVKTSEYNIR